MILESVPAYIAYRDDEGRLLTANAAARRVAWSDENRASDAAALSDGQPLLGSVERWEDSSIGARWVRTDRIPFTTARNTPARLLVVATDVTELVENRQHLAEANAGLNQFTYIASHDLQEPLRKIGTFTDLLLEGLETGNRDDVDYSVRVIKDSARRASSLIQDLLTWSRLTNRALEKNPLAFTAFVRDTLRDVLSARPDVAVEVDDRMQDVTVRADPGQVRQLIENIATNAVKYRSPDRPARFALRCEPTGHGTLLFAFEDNGIGFDPVYRDVIFEPFRRLHSDRQYPGSGIGLAICAKVCERHGWTMRAHGLPGRGATFEVEIPLKPAS
jgi:signal transduction histidine kinase